MQCDCIKKINEKLREETGDPEAQLNTMLQLSNGNRRICVPYLYRQKKKDGSFTKEKDGFLALDKCPFCGTPAEPEKQLVKDDSN